MANLIVTGRITSADNEAVSGLAVQAFFLAPGRDEQPIGPAGKTDAQGRYEILLTPASLRKVGSMRGVQGFIRAFEKGAVVGRSDARPVTQSPVTIDLQLAARGGTSESTYRVYGVVRDSMGELLSEVTLEALDRDLRSAQSLGTSPAKQGAYEIRYDPGQFVRSEKDSADLVVRVIDAAGRELHRTPVQFNAPQELELNIQLDGSQHKGPSEWEQLTSTLTPLLDGVAPADLREDSQHQDVSFLSQEADIPRFRIAVWIASFRVSDSAHRLEAPLAPEAIFAFLRQDQPLAMSEELLSEMQDAERAALLNDKILNGIAQLGPDLQKSFLEQALEANLVPLRVRATIPEILATLKRLALHALEGSTFGGGKGTIGQLLRLTTASPDQQTAIVAALSGHAGSMGAFWAALRKNPALRPEVVRNVRLTFEIGTLTRNHVPLVAALVNRFTSDKLKAKRELATFSRDDWKRILAEPGADGQPIGVPSNIDGETDEAKREQFAVILEQQMQRAYPTAFLAATLSRTEKVPIRAKADVLRFLSNSPALQLDRYRLDHYIARNRHALDGVQDKESMLRDLKAVQRVFRLNSSYTVVNALLSRGIDSAQQIYFMGRGQFMTRMGDAGVARGDARRVFSRAENAYAMALSMYAEYNRAVNGVNLAGVPEVLSDEQTAPALKTLPNLASLFGSLDYCECLHCRSVYSPAAYFVDVMRFLRERGTHGTGVNAGKNVAQVLLERRPDLGDVELSCENTNTPLPYIDLVNEVLEDVVSPPTPTTLAAAIEPDLVAGTIKLSVLNELQAKSVALDSTALVYAPDIRGHWAVRDGKHSYRIFKTGGTLRLLPTRQTFLSAAELRANPEYTNGDAYDKLRQEVSPLDLPFHLWQLQVRAYLDHLGVPQARLFELFQKTLADGVTHVPTDLQIDCAWLGITETERQILTGSLPGRQPWEFWGLAQNANNIPNPATPDDPTANVTGTWVNVLASVDVMLNRSGLEYRQLPQLLDMKYVNPTGSVFIFDTADVNAASCDTSLFTIRNLTEDVLNRMHRFIRFWRKLGCEMWELDILLPDVDPSPAIDKRITDAVIQDISRINRLRGHTELDWRSLYSFYNSIDHNVYPDRSRSDATLQTLYERLFRNKLVDAVASFPASADLVAGPIADAVPGISAALRISEADLDAILLDVSLAKTDALDADRLTRLYRIAALAKALGLSVDAFLRLKRLSAMDPFADPATTLRFVKLANEQVAASDFSIVELDYLLAHRFPVNAGVALEDKMIVQLLQVLRDGLQKINDELKLKPDESGEAWVKSKLGRLPALGKDADQVTALAIIAGTWQGTLADRNALIDSLFVGVLDLVVAKVNLAAIAGGLSPEALQQAVDARFGWVQPQLEAWLIRVEQEALVREKVAEVLAVDVPSATALLRDQRLAGSATPLLGHINDPALIARKPDGTWQFALDEASFPRIFQSLRLLHKSALIVGKYRMKATELAWWLEGTHAADFGWMHPNELPIDTTTTVALEKWLALQKFFVWKETLRKTDFTAFEFASRVLDATQTSARNLSDLAALTGTEAADLTALAVAFHWLDAGAALDQVKQELRKPENLRRLADATAALRRLGVNAERALDWVTPEPGRAQAESLKQTVKAKYDLPQWLQVIQPLQDSFRERKRQALVNWIVAHPNQAAGQNWTAAAGLFSYYLIDVEMCACMLTSRLKQAAASAQLFVQRCLLNLEVDILAKTDVDPKWKQWKWMKRYRVWEANRKVFLYPENWIEPELRDEKSPIFRELETELLQTEVTKETAEQAFMNYLEKLEGVASLEIRASFGETRSAEESTLHVIGRQRSSSAPKYFYRRQINGARWTPWENGPEIDTNSVVSGVFNRRVYLLWPQLTEKADAPTKTSTPNAGEETDIPQPDKYWEMKLYRSELKGTKWTPKSLSDQVMTLRQVSPEGLALRASTTANLAVNVYQSGNAQEYAPLNRVNFDIIGSQTERVTQRDLATAVSVTTTTGGLGYLKRVENRSTKAWRLRLPPESQVFNSLVMNRSAGVYFGYSMQYLTDTSSITEIWQPFSHSIAANLTIPVATDATGAIQLFSAAVPNSFTVVDSYNRSFSTDRPEQFFFWDRSRTYFATYSGGRRRTYSGGVTYTRFNRAFRFFIHYHPFVELCIKELNSWGIKGLLNRRLQVSPASVPASPPVFEFKTYQPTNAVGAPWPVEDMDFTYAGAYSPYNWELFFHAPFFIASRLAANQRFEEALEWFHYIFDPTSTDNASVAADTPQQRFWITKPFFETTKADYYKSKIENIMLAIARGDAEARAQVTEWRNNPFNPHLIARMRTVAYQKNVLIKYVQTLIDWGDQLFRQFTIESVNEATQLYVLAASVLGPRPKSIPKRVPNPVKTLYQLQQEGIDDFGNVVREIENLIGPSSSLGSSDDDTPELPNLQVLYFCIPNNDKLLTLWDTVEDRLFKIRHCMNVEGVVMQMPLFEPPIDPALLVKAFAAGLDIGAILNDMSAPLPLYRFRSSIQRALEVCMDVRTLGASMLAALEKRDAEAFALLRSHHEIVMLDQMKRVKELQADEAERTYESLQESRKVIDERRKYYEDLVDEGLNAWETTSLVLSGGAIISEIVATVLNACASGTSILPQFTAGAAGFGGSPVFVVTTGGEQVSSGLSNAASVVKSVANILQMASGMTATIGGFNRRAEEWDFQGRLAKTELPQVDKQIAAADVRRQIAAQELKNHEKQRENQETEDEYIRTTKFTNVELYEWMIGQLSTVYFQSYQLAYDLAKRAERCLRFELGLGDTSYIQFGYWDSLRKGLMAGEKLFYDLKRLESAYYEQNRREYELTKHVSLSQLDPLALLMLRQNGECFIDLAETVFDMDYPGHYFRRLKSVSLSIPCTVGPYGTVACTLTLTRNHLRTSSQLLAGKYPRDAAIDDPRFRDDVAPVQSIATSSAQNDHGMFELSFSDERYLPFEGAGAISSWHLEINTAFKQLDVSTIADVIMHINYTARAGGEVLRAKALENFHKQLNDLALAENRRGLFRLFDLKGEFAAEWQRFLHPANPADDQALELKALAARLPYFASLFKTKKVSAIEVVAQMKDSASYDVQLSPLGTTPGDLLALSPEPTYAGLHRVTKDLTGAEVPMSDWTMKLRPAGAADFKSLPVDSVQELFLAVRYTIAP